MVGEADRETNEDNPAPDGEQYFAMALYFASARWGDGVGIHDYHAQADRLLRAMVHRKRIVWPMKNGQQHIAAEMDEAHAGRRVLAEQAVRYRGIFLNDEAPALSGWAREKFGGFNSKFYVHVFELLLRLRRTICGR